MEKSKEVGFWNFGACKVSVVESKKGNRYAVIERYSKLSKRVDRVAMFVGDVEAFRKVIDELLDVLGGKDKK